MFDLQAHRGGLGLTTESTAAAFATALSLGVTTLEFDAQVTRDLEVVVGHDRAITAAKFSDTGPVTPDDPMYPYVGRLVKDLTLEQLRTLDQAVPLPDHPDQAVATGARVLKLADVFALAKAHGADDVRFNIETKLSAVKPEETQEKGVFVRRVIEEIEAAGVADRTSIQSFDWSVLRMVHEEWPELGLVALSGAAFLQVGKPGASPWLGGIDIDDHDGDLVAAVATMPGVGTISPNYSTPENGRISDPAVEFIVTPEFVERAHDHDLRVVPWTCDDPATMHALLDAGIDGMITNRPDRMRDVLESRGMPLPTAYPARG